MAAAWLAIPLALLPFPNAARAAVFCATSAAALESMMEQAESNGESDTIRIVKGVFQASSGFGFVYSAPSSEAHDLTLSGGWDTGTPCGFQSVLPLDTSLTTSFGNVLQIQLYAGAIRVDNLNVYGSQMGFGLSVFAQTDPREVNVHIERTRFYGNSSGVSSTLRIRQVSELRVRNSLFLDNHSLTSNIYIQAPDNEPSAVYFTNNTIVANTSDLLDPTGGLSLVSNASTQALLANNILWGNDGIDLNLSGQGFLVILENNNIEELAGTADESRDNLSVDPLFVGQFRPRFDSPMVDAGTKPPFFLPFPVPFADNWTIGLLDFEGDDRLQGTRVDIGAVEAFPEIVFRNGYE